MRYTLFGLIALFNSIFLYGQVEICSEFKTGVFQFQGINGGVFTIIRTDTSQFERNSKQAQHSKMKIRWERDCYYILSDRIEYKWGKPPVKDNEINELGNIIYKFERPNKYYVKSFIPSYNDTIETIFVKLDTTKFYNNIFQLKEFSEYKNSKSYGQKLLGEIHSIDYYESHTKSNKYLIIFETTYHGETLNKTRLIDSVTVQLDDGEKITNSNCRLNREYDDEIVAIYKSQDETKEAQIIRAFRCSRITEKIEEVDVNLVYWQFNYAT